MNERQMLEREIAYSAARSDIERHCESKHHSGRYYGRWYDATSMDAGVADLVSKSIRYLELRKLLKRHPEDKTLVRIIDPE